MKKIFGLLITIALLSSCAEEKKETSFQQGKVSINGTIENYADNDSISKIAFYSKNIFELEQYQTHETDVDSLGNFSVQFKIPNMQTVFFYFGNNGGNLFVAPNQTMKLRFDGNAKNRQEVMGSLHVEGELSTINGLYSSYMVNDPIDYKNYYKDFTSKKTPEAVYNFVDSVYSLKNEYIDSYIKENTLPDELINWLAVEKEVKPITELLQYLLFYYRPTSKDNTLEENFGKKYLAKINNLPTISKESFVNEQIYTVLPNYYSPYLRQLVMSKYGTKDYKKSDSLLYKKELLLDTKNPLLTEILFYDRLKVTLNNNDLTFYEANKVAIDSIFKNTMYEGSIQKHYTSVKNLLENPDLPKDTELLTIEATDGKEILNEIIKNANGKVIYIDNWATWCGPCKQQFKEATPKLKKEFGKNVEFIYLCHQSNEKLYKPTIAQYQIGGKHYFMNKEQTKSLMEVLSITGFPTYNIINKKGKLVHSGFEYRPSESITSKIMSELVAE